MEFSIWKNLLVVLIMMAISTTGVSFVLQNKTYVADEVASVSNSLAVEVSPSIPLPPPPPQKLSNPPKIIKSVYVTAYSAGSKKYLDYLGNLLKNTEINAVVVDIKGSNGYVSYASGVGDVAKYNLYNNAIRDIDSLVRFFHDKNVYVIGRIAVFEDPVYSKARPELAIYDKIKTTDLAQPVLWQDKNGLSWLDPSSKDVWNYDISLAKDALYHGFDEINFDYIRFPSDGKTEAIGFPVYDGKIAKQEVIKQFFTYVRQQLSGEKISADLFGQTTVDTKDMGIGQIIENAFENFDYVSPMVYPSHFANGFIGFAIPAEHPYEVIKYSMDSGLNRKKALLNGQQNLLANADNLGKFATAGLEIAAQTKLSAPAEIIVPFAPLGKLRPWIQDFNMGADYTSDMVKAEIKAAQDALGSDFNGFMLWNPSNIYTQDAISKPS